jgi:hypothetical protein
MVVKAKMLLKTNESMMASSKGMILPSHKVKDCTINSPTHEKTFFNIEYFPENIIIIQLPLMLTHIPEKQSANLVLSYVEAWRIIVFRDSHLITHNSNLISLKSF